MKLSSEKAKTSNTNNCAQVNVDNKQSPKNRPITSSDTLHDINITSVNLNEKCTPISH